MDKLVTWEFAEKLPEDEAILAEYGSNPGDFAWNHTEYYRGVIGTIQSGKKALVDGLEGRKSIELITALYESAETGREVNLRFQPKRSRLGVSDNG